MVQDRSAGRERTETWPPPTAPAGTAPRPSKPVWGQGQFYERSRPHFMRGSNEVLRSRMKWEGRRATLDRERDRPVFRSLARSCRDIRTPGRGPHWCGVPGTRGARSRRGARIAGEGRPPRGQCDPPWRSQLRCGMPASDGGVGHEPPYGRRLSWLRKRDLRPGRPRVTRG